MKIEIKYKAFLINEKRIVDVETIHWNKGYGGALQIHVDNPKHTPSMILDKPYDPENPFFFTYINHTLEAHLKNTPHEFILLQHVGESDNNGVDIYEGDKVDICVFFVSPENPDDDQHFRGSISFEDGCFLFTIKKYLHYEKGWIDHNKNHPFGHMLEDIEDEKQLCIPLFDIMGFSGNLGDFIPDNIEVIGNIYEKN